MMINKCLLSPNHLGPLGLLSGAALFLLLLFPASSSSFGHGPMFLPGGGHQMPSFLRDVNGQARRQFFQIVRSPNDTKAQVQAQLNSWAQQNGVQAAMQNFTQSQQQRAEQIRANLTNLLAGPAVQLLNDYWTVRQNMGISRVSECQQIRQLMEAAQPLLRRLVPIPPSVIPGPPPRACFFRGPFSPGGPGDSDGDLPGSSRRMRRAVPNPPANNNTEEDSGLEGEDAEDT